MNTEKIEKLKKSLSNSKIPADLKPKIEAEIKRLEDLDAKQLEAKEEAKEEAKPVAKKTTARKPRTKKPVAKRTSTRKPSETSKPKRTAMSVAKEIRKEGESWKDAMARASKVMKEKTQTATKDVESELDKLTKLVRSKKELKGQVYKTDLLRDAKRKAKPMGKRISKDGNVYYENRPEHSDRGTYGKYHLAEGGGVGIKYIVEGDKVLNTHTNMYVDYDFGTKQNAEDFANHRNSMFKKFGKDFAEGGYLTDPTFGTFQNQVFEVGGDIENQYEGRTPKDIWNSLTRSQRKHFLIDHYYIEKEYFFQQEMKWFSVEDEKMINTLCTQSWDKLDSDVKKAFRRHVEEGQYAEGGYLTDPTFGNFQSQVFAKGGYTQEGENYEYINTFDIPQKDFIKLVEAYHKSPSYNQAERIESRLIFSDMRSKYGKDKVDEIGNYIHELHEENNYAKGGGIRRKNGQTYDYGRVWTKDHNEFDKSADHEVNYRRKKLAKGGRIESLKKELYRLQRELNSSRLQTYRLGDNSQEAKDRKKEREVKLARFNEVLKELRESDAKFELGGTIVTDLAGHTGGSLGGDPTMLDGFSNTSYTGLVGETGAMSSGEMFAYGGGVKFKPYGKTKGRYKITYIADGEKQSEIWETMEMAIDNAKRYEKIDDFSKIEVFDESGKKIMANGGGLPDGASQSYMITESLGNPAQHFAKGGGIRRKNGQTYDYGRVWTKDHNEFDKSADHEVNYRRKGKFLGVFAKGGGVKSDRYDGKTEKIVKELKNLKGGLDNKAPYVYQRDGYIYVSAEEGDNYADYDNYLYIDEKLEDFADKYDTYWDWENAGAIILVPLSDGYAKGGVMAKGGGVNDESPKIYVADLEAYNNGRLSGVWLDLADYNDADELMEAIQDFLKTTGGEEYAIHDVENIPNSMYSEYMGQRDFEELYEMIDLAKEKDLPLSVVQEVISQYDASAVDEFYGQYDDAEDFAQSLVDDLGIESFIDFQYYLEVSDTDRRILAGEMADNYVYDIRDEDGGNRLIEEAGLDLDEYEEADSDRQEEMLDEAEEIVRQEYYYTWYDGLSDPYYFLVEEQGLYSAEDFAKANFVRIDYEKLGDALEQDYTFIYDGGSLYVFNIR